MAWTDLHADMIQQLKTNSGGWPRLSARDCVQLFVQRSSARPGAHPDSMTYAHLVPRARACAVYGAGAGVFLLQKPCCFLVSYKNKRRSLLFNHSHSHNHISTSYQKTPPPQDSSPTKITHAPITMPTYIVSIDYLGNPISPSRVWRLLAVSDICYRRLRARRMRPLSRSTRKINTAPYNYLLFLGSQTDSVYSAKKHAEAQGGKIGHSYNLIKGFS